jgi:hypothetical protein
LSTRKARREIDKAIRHLIDYEGPDNEWTGRLKDLEREFFSPVAKKLDLDWTELADVFQCGPYAHMVFGFLFEEYASTHWDNEKQSLIGAYLKHRGWREGVAGRRYLQALDQAELGFWEVTAVKRGAHVEIRPYGSKEKSIRVKEQAATETLRQWDGLAARVLRSGSEYTFSGAMLTFRPDSARRVQALMDSVGEQTLAMMKSLVDEGELDALPDNIDVMLRDSRYDEFAGVAFGLWVMDAYQSLTSAPPEIRNTDDERIELIQQRFPLTGERVLVAGALNAAPLLDRDGDSNDCWVWLPKTVDDIAEGERVSIHGHIVLTDTTLQLECNSRGRADRGRALLTSLLGNLIGQPLTVYENMERLGEQGEFAEIPEEAAPEVQAVIDAHLSSYYRQTLDEPIPMLGGKTPRECAADPRLREEVIQWLKYLENTEMISSRQAYDFGWMWDELNLERE